MDFSHYTDRPVEFAAALVNTNQLPAGGVDGIADLEGLELFLAVYRDLWEGETAEPSAPDLTPIHELRSLVRQVFGAPDIFEAADLLNRILAENIAIPRISVHGDNPHFHFETTGTSLPTWLAVVAAMGLATVLIDHGVERFGVCESETCRDVFIDTSRNRSRRHCSATCSTREHVAAHRRRKRTNPAV